jgi:hypothetical protein
MTSPHGSPYDMDFQCRHYGALRVSFIAEASVA